MGFRAVADSGGLVRFTAGEHHHPMVLECSPQGGRRARQIWGQTTWRPSAPTLCHRGTLNETGCSTNDPHARNERHSIKRESAQARLQAVRRESSRSS